MAGDWIKVESTTPDKPEVLMISEYLDISPETVLGHLIRFWIWVDYQQQNCNGLSVTKKSIDRITRMQNFADAMINCGWLIENNGNLSIPNFDFHNGNTAKTRATTYKRVKKHRNDNVTVEPLQKEDIRVTREEKRRDLNTSTKPKRNIKEKKDSLPDPSFLIFYESYPRHIGKSSAEKAWKKIRSSEEVMEGLERWKQYWDSERTEQRFIPYPATWLNKNQWLDELLVDSLSDEMAAYK